MTSAVRRLQFRRQIFVLALLAAVSTTAAAQSSTFSAGTLLNVPAFNPATTTGSTMGGMLVTWTFAGFAPVSANWGDLGGGVWGVSVGNFRVTQGAGSNTFAVPWVLTNATNNRVLSVRFDGAPGLTVFDCARVTGALGCTEDTPGSNAGRSLMTTGGTYGGAVTGLYTNVVSVGSSPAVGDVFEQLTIRFDDIQGLGAQSTYQFIADTDNFLPEPVFGNGFENP